LTFLGLEEILKYIGKHYENLIELYNLHYFHSFAQVSYGILTDFFHFNIIEFRKKRNKTATMKYILVIWINYMDAYDIP